MVRHILLGFREIKQNLTSKGYLHQYLLTVQFLFVCQEFQHFISLQSVFLTSPSSERCYHTIQHAVLVAPDEPFLTDQHEQLDLLPLLLFWTLYNTDAKLPFSNSWLLTLVCTMSINANMHVLDDVTQCLWKCMKCSCLRQSLQRGISFIPQKFVHSKLGPSKSITTVGKVHPK